MIQLLGQQLLFAIEPVLKDQWTPEVEQAWADLFRFMTHLMKEAMILWPTPSWKTRRNWFLRQYLDMSRVVVSMEPQVIGWRIGLEI